MRIAVTGATGFVGGAIADHLASQGHDVLAIGRRPRPDGYAHDYASWDLSTDAPAPPALAGCGVVVHAAAHVTPWGPDAPFRAVTVAGTERLLRAIDPAARLVIIGSASVYDPRVPHDRAREAEAPVAPDRYLNAYGRAKADQERLVLATRPNAIVLRPRAVWGPGDTTLLPRILGRVRRNRLPLPDGGRHAMSATHITSLTAAVAAAIERPGVAGPVNVADATATTAGELLGTLFVALDMRVHVMAVPAPLTWAAAGASEAVWRVSGRSDEPPVTRFAVAGLARPFTLDLGRLHGELGAHPDVDLARAASQLHDGASRTRAAGRPRSATVG